MGYVGKRQKEKVTYIKAGSSGGKSEGVMWDKKELYYENNGVSFYVTELTRMVSDLRRGYMVLLADKEGEEDYVLFKDGRPIYESKNVKEMSDRIDKLEVMKKFYKG